MYQKIMLFISKCDTISTPMLMFSWLVLNILSVSFFFLKKKRKGPNSSSRYSRVPNITGVPNESVGGNFFLKINKTEGDLIKKESRIRTCRTEKHPKKNNPVLFGTLDKLIWLDLHLIALDQGSQSHTLGTYY